MKTFNHHQAHTTSQASQPSGALLLAPCSLSKAFTLVEICIAMTIGMLILGVAVLGITGVQEEQKLRESAAMIESTARDSLLKAIAEHRPVQLSLAGGITGAEGSVEIKRYGEREYRKPDRAEVWEFSPTGVCEPLHLRITSATGTIELGFDPLTGCARSKNIIVSN